MPRGQKVCGQCGAQNGGAAKQCVGCEAPFVPKRAKTQGARSAPRPKAPAVAVRHNGNGNGDRASSVRALGDGLLENVHGTWELFKTVLEDQLDESTPMIQAALDAHTKALDLLQAGYRVAT